MSIAKGKVLTNGSELDLCNHEGDDNRLFCIQKDFDRVEAAKTSYWIPVHRMESTQGEDKCSPLLYWYAFTACNCMSSLVGKGKAIAWQS